MSNFIQFFPVFFFEFHDLAYCFYATTACFSSPLSSSGLLRYVFLAGHVKGNTFQKAVMGHCLCEVRGKIAALKLPCSPCPWATLSLRPFCSLCKKDQVAKQPPPH